MPTFTRHKSRNNIGPGTPPRGDTLNPLVCLPATPGGFVPRDDNSSSAFRLAADGVMFTEPRCKDSPCWVNAGRQGRTDLPKSEATPASSRGLASAAIPDSVIGEFNSGGPAVQAGQSTGRLQAHAAFGASLCKPMLAKLACAQNRCCAKSAIAQQRPFTQ
jgi:hypothetical protein